MEEFVHIKICGWSGCDIAVESVNLNTGKLYYHCDTHRRDRKVYSQTYFKKNKVRQNRVTLENYHKLRKRVLDMYGSKCQCCGEEQEAFLALDHVNGGGQKHRRERGAQGVYRDALAAYDPDRFQVLCHNCNFATHTCGVCPHTLAKENHRAQ